MLSKRVAVVLIPRFSIALLCRENPTRFLEAVTLVEDDAETATILEVNGKAAKAGIAMGMTIAQGEMLCPGLIRVLLDRQREEKATAKICELLRQIAPAVKTAGSGCFVSEAEGFDHLYGGESQLAQRLIDAVKTYGLPVQVGIADNQFVAKVAAETSRGCTCTVVPPSQAQSFLQSLSTKHLSLKLEFQDQLANLGLRTIGQVAQFPANEIVERFGREGWLASRLARGEDPEFFVPETPPDDWQEEIYLGFAIYRAEQIGNYVRLLLEKLFGKLKVVGKACTQITVQLRCDDRSRHTLEVAVDKPTLSLERFLRQLRCKLAEVDLPSGVIELGVGPVVTTSQAIEQLALPGGNCRNGGGSSSATTATPVSGQPLYPILQYAPIPELTYQLLPQRPSVKVASAQTQILYTPFCQRSLVGLRLIEPAQELEVGDNHETLRVFKWRGRKQRVMSQRGPWQVSGNWWDGAFARRYYEIEIIGGATYLCYCDQGHKRWYVQGVFD
jgi:nucleotidyltransferase/DNA polymerase involved in DNA repair